MFAWHYSILSHIAINKASMIVVEGNQLLDATIVASLAIFLSSAGVTQMYKMPGPEVKAVVIRAMVVVMVVVMGRPVIKPMPWMPMSSRGIWLVSFNGINQDHLVIMSSGLMRLSQKTKFMSCS